MWEEISKYVLVFATSMVKFIFGPIAGASAGLSFLETVLLTIGGMMMTVLLLSYLGAEVRKKIMQRFSRNQKKFTPRNRKIVKVWRKYGAFGVSFLTPVFFSPIIGTLIVIGFGEHKARIFQFMLVSACFWSLVINGLIFFVGQEVIMPFVVQY